MSQKQLAARIGVNNSRVSNWEQGINRPDTDVLAAICVAPDVSPSLLLGVPDIFAGKSRPRRNHAIMLAFGLHCDLRQTQRLLRLADVAELWCKQRRDAILIWCIENGLTREEADDELFRLGEQTLLGTDRLS